MINDGIDLESRCLTRVCTADRHTLSAGHEGPLQNSNTNELAFREIEKFWDFPGRGRARTVKAAASLLPIPLRALKRSAYRTNTAVVPASPQLLIPSTTASTACVRADTRSHRRLFQVPRRIALPRSFPIERSGFCSSVYVDDGQAQIHHPKSRCIPSRWPRLSRGVAAGTTNMIV